MANIVAQGQVTIVDMHDMPPVQGRLTSNQPKIVVLSSDGTTQSPNWASNNLIVTAELFKAGDASDLITSGNSAIKGITWYITQGSGAETTTLPSGVTPGKTGSSAYNNILTINQRLLSSSVQSLKFRAVINFQYSGIAQNVPVSVEIDFALANNGVAGEDSYSAFLTNTSATIATSTSGSVVQTGGFSIETKAIVYKGITQKTEVVLSTTPKDGVALPSGVTIIQGATNDSVLIKFAQSTNQDNKDNGLITLVASVDGKTFDLVFSWSKSKQGNAGVDSVSYWMIPSTSAIVKKWNGTAWVFEPSSVSVTGMSQTGSGAATAFTTKYKIQLYNGSTPITDSGCLVETTGTSATLNIASLTSKTFTHIVFTMYNSSSGSTVIDEEKAMLVEQTKKPVVVSVYTESDTIRNNTGSAVIKVLVYKDGTDISASAVKAWYKGTTAISGQTGTSLTVTAADVPTSQMYSCKVTEDGTVYSDSILIYDASDPIQMAVDSSNGDVFKNGNGTTVLTCNLWRENSPLDDTGSDYAYCWKKYNNAGAEVADWVPANVNTTASNTIMTTTTAAISGNTVTVNDIANLKVGYKVFLAAATTPLQISAIDVATKKLTFTTTPAATTSGSTVKLMNYKKITVTNSDVDEKATFVCQLVG